MCNVRAGGDLHRRLSREKENRMNDSLNVPFAEHLKVPTERVLAKIRPGAYGEDLDPRYIRPEPGFNARDFTLPENLEHVEDLRRSIAVQGVLNPVRVRLSDDKSEVWLTDGESRWRAAMSAIAAGSEIKAIPYIVEGRRQSTEERIVNLVVSNTGKRLSPLETLDVANRLKGFKWSDREVAQRLGLTPSYLQHLFLLKRATPATIGLVRDGTVKASTVIDELRHGKEPKRLETQLRRAVEGEGGVRRTRVQPRDLRAKAERDAPIYNRETAAFLAEAAREAYHLLPGSLRKPRQLLRSALENANVPLEIGN